MYSLTKKTKLFSTSSFKKNTILTKSLQIGMPPIVTSNLEKSESTKDLKKNRVSNIKYALVVIIK